MLALAHPAKSNALVTYCTENEGTPPRGIFLSESSNGWIDFAVFVAHAPSNSESENSRVLAQLTTQARMAGHKIDQAALAFSQNGHLKFFGTPELAKYLSKSGLPRWTHTIAT